MGALFEKCERCNGTRKLIAYHTDSYQEGDACPFCSTGYNEIGMTGKQLEAMHEERDKLLEFVARVAEISPADVYGSVFGVKQEAKELVKGKAGRVEEYRARKGLGAKSSGAPSAPVPPPDSTG